MTREFYSDGSITFRVEASDKDEARDIIKKIIEDVRANLPTGVVIGIGEHHQTREINVFNG